MLINMLYYLIIQGVKDYLCQLDMRDLPIVTQYAQSPDPPGSLEFLQAAKPIMDSYSLNIPNSIEEAMDLYVILTTAIEEFVH